MAGLNDEIFECKAVYVEEKFGGEGEPQNKIARRKVGQDMMALSAF